MSALKKAIMPAMLVGAMMAGMQSEVPSQKEEEPKQLVVYKETRVWTPEQRLARKQHRAKLKARRNARKGIYNKKIVYKKGGKKICQN